MALQTRREKVRYSDFKIDFNIHPDQKDLTRSINEDSVKRSIKNLLFTSKNERFFQPNLGAGLKAYLFENIGQTTASLIKRDIKNTIENFENRARLLNVRVIALPDENAYAAEIVFATINRIEPITLNVILTRTR
jgi:phage baseplate assembly protein W